MQESTFQFERVNAAGRSLWGGLSALVLLALAVSLGVSADQLLASTTGTAGVERVQARAEQSRLTVANRREQERPNLAAQIDHNRALTTAAATIRITDRDDAVPCLVHVTNRATPPPAA